MEKDLEISIEKLLTSENAEDVEIGLELCKKRHPFVYTALLDLKLPTTGMHSMVTLSLSQVIETLKGNLDSLKIGLGTKVRYRLMKDCPEIVVTDLILIESKNSFFKTKGVQIEGKYYNKSKQEFATIRDRIECFEIIN